MIDILCEKCGIKLPPMEKGEGEPCPTGYICRDCLNKANKPKVCGDKLQIIYTEMQD